MNGGGIVRILPSVRYFTAVRTVWPLPTKCRRLYTPPVVTGVTEEEIQSARSYCSSLIQRFDAPAYTLQTFVPKPARDAYVALRAFNVDVARVGDATSNSAVGAMRMQFWRDAVTRALEFSPPKEPVAVLLAAAASSLTAESDGKNKLSRSWMHRVINTREKHLQNPPYPNLAALEMYAENTYSTLLYLTLSAMPMTSVTADHLASHIGKAQGIVAVLRGLPLLAFPPPPNKHSNQAAFGVPSGGNQQGSVMLPLDIMAETGVREDEVFRKGTEASGLRDAVFAVATRASDHLITAREMLKNLKSGKDVGHEFEHAEDQERDSSGSVHAGVSQQLREAKRAHGILMASVPAQLWLDRLQQLDFDIFSPKLRTTDWKLPMKAYWAYQKGQL